MDAKKTRVKFFYGHVSSFELVYSFEAKINSWLEEQENVEIVDIKFADDSNKGCQCMVIYQVKE